MRIWKPKNRDDLRNHLSDPLFKNAYFLMLSSITSAGSGFFFWLIVARFYPAEEVGLASAIISAMNFILILSLLGFDISLVRFIPERKDKMEFINTCLTISFITSLSLASIFVAGISIWAPSLSMIMEKKTLLFLFLLYTSIIPLASLQSRGIFAGFRKAEYSFILMVVTFARIGVVPFLTIFGALGIYLSYGLTSLLAFLIGIFLISKIITYKPIPTVKKDVINEIFHYSLGNYIAGVFQFLPNVILPIMVLNVLGAEQNAYFFIAWSVSNLLVIIPGAVSTSLLAEGSYEYEKLEWNIRKAMKFTFVLIGISIPTIFILGDHILWIFGEKYAEESFDILRVLVLGAVPFSVNTIYAYVKRIQKKVKSIILVYGGISILTLVGGYLMMLEYGIIGIGFAWVLANLIVTAFIFFHKKLI